MKIIAGSQKGRTLKTLDGISTRPPLEHIRAAIFNIIHDKVKGADVLDLFAGSGSIGIEALSRGAKSCTFIEANFKALKVLKNNLKDLNYNEHSQCLSEKIPQVLKQPALNQNTFDLIFIDAPFDAIMQGQFLQLEVQLKPLLSENGWIINRYPENSPLTEEDNSLTLIKEKKYGISEVKIFAHPQKEDQT